jgi:glycosyltransferase involved in cell wall biosynthesis
VKNKKIYFIASLGDLDSPNYGGGEIGNRRTLSLLRKNGFDVTPINRFLFTSRGNSIFGFTKQIAPIISNLIKVFILLLKGRRKLSIVHISGFYGSTIYYEAIITIFTKLLGYKSIYELRGGGAQTFYNEGTWLYRILFKLVIRCNNSLFSQGIENYDLIKTISTNKRIFYYPNYVQNEFSPQSYPIKPNNNINIIYFGRISPDKQIDLIVKALDILNEKYSNVNLTIIGNYNNRTKPYLDLIKDTITTLSLNSKVKILPACTHNELKTQLRDKHFYIFPSINPREGHSNSLTEAMTWGVIPITSSQGFSKTVIGVDKLVINEANEKIFASTISDIIEKKEISILSEKMYRRIKQNYTEDIVSIKLCEEYNVLFDLYN